MDSSTLSHVHVIPAERELEPAQVADLVTVLEAEQRQLEKRLGVLRARIAELRSVLQVEESNRSGLSLAGAADAGVSLH